MIRPRLSSSGAWREIARFGRSSQPAISARPGRMPTVETVIRWGEIHSVRMSSAALTLARLSSGSPIPMKTRFSPSMGRSRSARIASTWPTISPAVRLRPAPQ
jgi:hypothetical protein